MPKISGLGILKKIKKMDPSLPVIIITGTDSSENIITAIRYGAYDYLKKPFKLPALSITVQEAIKKRKMQLELDRYHQMLEIMVKRRTEQLTNANEKLEQNLIGSILAMVNALEASDKYTKGHSERVTAISLSIGKKLNLSLQELKFLRLGSIMHDIGKIGIAPNILNKPSILNDNEYDIIKSHPNIGKDILEPIDMNQQITEIVNQHHERIDGTGYPKKITGEKINALAKIVSVADTFDAITSNRPYRAAKSKEYAMEELSKSANTQLDKTVVNSFIKNIKEILAKLPENIASIKKL